MEDVLVEITITGRQTTISDRFRDHIADKLAKIEQLAPRALRVEAHVTHEKNARQPETSERVELTVVDKGPVIRAEATASDRYGALDLAYAKLLERLRRNRDRKKLSLGGRHRPESTAEALAKVPVGEAAEGAPAATPAPAAVATLEPVTENDATLEISSEGDSPVLVREKVFEATPIALDEALSRMELVGHDFYLFIDEKTSRPAVVYRRKGWSYGVICLDAQ